MSKSDYSVSTAYYNNLDSGEYITKGKSFKSFQLAVKNFNLLWDTDDSYISTDAESIVLTVMQHLVCSLKHFKYNQSAKILLQCAPDTPLTKATEERCVRHLSNLEGVLEVREERYWSIDGTTCTGTFCIRAHANADEQAILKNAEILCKPTFKYLNIQIEKDPPTTWFLSKRNK